MTARQEPTRPTEATLEGMAAELGAPTKAALRFAFRGADEGWMLRAGQSVASETVLAAGTAFVASTRSITARMPAEKLRLALGYNPVLLPVLVAELLALHAQNQQYDRLARASSMSGDGRRHEAREAWSSATVLRQTTFQAMRDVLGADHTAVVGVGAAMRAADTADILASGLEALADTLHALRHGADGQKPDRELLGDLDLGGLDDAHVNALRDAASRVRDTATLAAARPQDLAAAQRALDLQDGHVLHVVGLVVKAFRRARRSDPKLLVPELGDLRRIYGTAASSNASAEEEDEEEDTPTGGGGGGGGDGGGAPKPG